MTHRRMRRGLWLAGTVLLLAAGPAAADLSKADALRGQGKYAEAAREYESMLAVQPGHPSALYGAGLCYTMLGVSKRDKALFDKAGGYLHKLVDAHPANGAYRSMLGYWAFSAAPHMGSERAAYLERAGRELKKALETHEDDFTLATLGQVHLARGRYEDARMVFGVLSPKHPRNHFYAFWLGQAEAGLAGLRRKASDEEAAAVHEKAAVEAFLRTLGANPNYTPAYEPLRKVFTRLRSEGRQDRAMELLRRILAVEPHPWIKGWVLWELAANQTDQGDYEGAVESLRQAEKACPTEAMFSNTLALNYLTLGRNEEAVASLRKASEKNPALLYAWENLGHTLAAQGKTGEARDAFLRGHQEAAKVKKTSPRADLRAEADLYLFLFVYYLDQLEENAK